MLKYVRRNPNAGVVIAVALFVLVGVIVWMSMPTSRRVVTKGYFTVDEGQTWFIDDVKRVTPFDKDGKPAVRCYVFQCPEKPVYCGLLSRHTEEARKKVEGANGGQPNGLIKDEKLLDRGSREFKHPGDSSWASESSGAMFQLTMQKKCASGQFPTSVVP